MSCHKLSPVTLVAVMRCERNDSVSSGPGHNIYQFPSHTDSDMATTLGMSEITRLHRRSASPCERNGLPRPVFEQVRNLSHKKTTPSRTNSRVMPTAATLLGVEGAKQGMPPLQTLSALTAASPVQINTRTSSSMSGGLHLNTLLRSLLLGLVVASSGTTPPYIVLGSLARLLPVAMANRFALKNGYGTVEALYHLKANDCSDPSEVQAYSSVPASHCSIRATPVQTQFQLLQKEKKRYLTAYACFLFRTDIRYNCGVCRHPELDPLHWSFSVPQRMTFEQSMMWLHTRTYRPGYYSTMMHGKDFYQPILLDEPNYITYLVYSRNYTQAPALPTEFQTLPAKASGSNTNLTSRSTTSSPSTMNYISGLSTWSSRMVRLSTRIASGLFIAHGRRDTATQRASPTSGMSVSQTTARSLSSRSFSATAYMPMCPTRVP